MGGGGYGAPDVSGIRGLGERGEAPQQVLITTKNSQLAGGGGANFTEFIYFHFGFLYFLSFFWELL